MRMLLYRNEISCVYASAEKITELKLIMLDRAALYSQTETR